MASGTIEITMPLRRVITASEQGGWLHAMYGDMAVVELDDGSVVHVTSKYMRFVEPYSKETVYEDHETSKVVRLALKYKDLISLAEEAQQYGNIKLRFVSTKEMTNCHRCAKFSPLNDDYLCLECCEKITTIRNLLGL